jgi:CRISPR-associated endoribonuclease Cas6
MRVRLQFQTDEPVLLPWEYVDWLRGLCYALLSRSSPRLAARAHDQGSPLETKTYKPLVFSFLQLEKPQPVAAGLKAEGRLIWYVSSPLSTIMEAFLDGVSASRAVRLGPYRLVIVQVDIVPDPPFSERMQFVTLSPLVVSTGVRRADGRFTKRFVKPGEPEFDGILSNNLRRKAEALFGATLSGDVRLSWLQAPRSKLTPVAGLRVRGWTGRLEASGPAELLRVGYEAGFGERNAQGFGMVACVS